jgi:hypothetical protein
LYLYDHGPIGSLNPQGDLMTLIGFSPAHLYGDPDPNVVRRDRSIRGHSAVEFRPSSSGEIEQPIDGFGMIRYRQELDLRHRLWASFVFDHLAYYKYTIKVYTGGRPRK